jgi:hypothetical protein
VVARVINDVAASASSLLLTHPPPPPGTGNPAPFPPHPYDASLIARISPHLLLQRKVVYSPDRYDFRAAIRGIIAPSPSNLDPFPFSELHLSPAGVNQLSSSHNAGHSGRGPFNKRWRARTPEQDAPFRRVLGLFVAEVLTPLLDLPPGSLVVYQRSPTLRVHFHGQTTLGSRHRDYGCECMVRHRPPVHRPLPRRVQQRRRDPPSSRAPPRSSHPRSNTHTDKRQPQEINCWLPVTPVDGTNSLWAESAPGKKDFAPFKCEGPGEAVLFHGSQCEHYTLPNFSGRTRVSIDFRIIPGGAFEENYVAPYAKDTQARFVRGKGRAYTDTQEEEEWRAAALPTSTTGRCTYTAPPRFQGTYSPR